MAKTLIRKYKAGEFTLTQPEFVWAEPERIGSEDGTHGLFELISNLETEYIRGLDMGCGIGTLSFAMSKICKEVIGADISKRALEFAEKNKEINKVENIDFIHSDLYSNVEGKFDLIISNPFFVFCPDDKGARWYYGYGGELGIEQGLNIIEGFDKYLSKNGEAFLILSSPIIKGNNILIEKLNKYVEERKYEIELKELSLYYIKELHSFYSEYNIDYFILYLAYIKDNFQSKLKIKKLNSFKRLAARIYIENKKW